MKKLLLILAALSLLSCSRHADTVIIISANAEWKALGAIIKPENSRYKSSPYGQWFPREINGRRVIFFHGGWGKIDAAGSAQYAIDTFNPRLIINIGTAGGFPGKINKGDMLLVNRAITYDIYERMGEAGEAIDYYTTDLECPGVPMDKGLMIGPIASADQDLLPGNVASLHRQYGALAGDWESSAIAHTAKKNKVQCYIIRGITDIVHPAGSETYGDYAAFERETEKVMRRLVKIMQDIL